MTNEPTTNDDTSQDEVKGTNPAEQPESTEAAAHSASPADSPAGVPPQAAKLLTPLAIVIGFALVASAIYLRDGEVVQKAQNPGPGTAPEAAVAADGLTRDESPNLYGDPEAPITIVEFSDYECPFCARLHPTLKRIVDESDGDINWEYRHLPLRSHRNAMTAAIIGECVAEHAGNDAFWTYTNTVFTDGPGEASFYEEAAVSAGVEAATLTECTGRDDIQAIVQADLDQAQSVGASGTPFNVIIFPDGTTKPVRGALPYASWAQALELD